MIIWASIYTITLLFTLGVITSILGKVELTKKFADLASVGVLILTLAIIIRGIVNLIKLIV